MPITTDPISVGTQPTGDVVATPIGDSQPIADTPVRSGNRPSVVVGNDGYGTGVMPGGFDPASIGRKPAPADVQPVQPTQPVQDVQPAKKTGFFSRVGRVLSSPFRLPKIIAAKSKGLARAAGYTGLATGAAGVAATAAYVVHHVAPAALHGLVHAIGVEGILGPPAAALGGAAIVGGLTALVLVGAIAFLVAGRKAKQGAPAADA